MNALETLNALKTYFEQFETARAAGVPAQILTKTIGGLMVCVRWLPASGEQPERVQVTTHRIGAGGKVWRRAKDLRNFTGSHAATEAWRFAQSV